MKNTLFILILSVLFSVNIFAGNYNNKLSVDANMFLVIHKYASEHNKIKKSDFLNSEDEKLIKLYVKVNTDYNKSDIEILDGVEIVKTKSIVLIQLPIKNVDALSQYDFVEKIDIVRKLQKHLDKALPKANVSNVHTGEGLNSSYTGKGVLIGLADLGIDFRHAMFSDTNGVPRVKRA